MDNLAFALMEQGKADEAEPLCRLALAMKRDFRIEPQRDASNRAWELNATAIYGVGELDDSFGVEMYFDAGL